MFKSMDRTTNRDVVILDPAWNNTTIGPLRKKGREDHLLCPTCKQPVRVRAGEKKRWHFAHKSLSDCPLAYETPTVLQARSLLYKWLKSKLGDAVTIEKYFPDANLPRPIDCYFETSADHKVGYWILEKGIRSRYPLQSALGALGIDVQWVLLSNMVRIDAKDSESIHLSPTERDFMFSSKYNEVYSQHDKALHFLDVDECTVTTFRGLYCVHQPQLYRWHAKLQNALVTMLVLKLTGELVHPGEHEELQGLENRRLLERQHKELQRQQQKEELLKQEEQIRQNQLIRQQNRAARLVERMAAASNARPEESLEKRQPSEIGTGSHQDHYKCMVCGKFTKDWTVFDTKTNTCVCSRECLRKKQGRS
jgi:hypothetical protein